MKTEDHSSAPQEPITEKQHEATVQAELVAIVHTKNVLSEQITRCEALAEDIEAFRDHLKRERREQDIQISAFRGHVKSQLKHLNKLAQQHQSAPCSSRLVPESQPDNQAIEWTARVTSVSDTEGGGKYDLASLEETAIVASNLPHLECCWNAAKSSSGLVTLYRYFLYDRKNSSAPIIVGSAHYSRPRQRNVSIVKRKPALVDVVTSHGLEWIKVSLVTNNRMLMERAREGWFVDSSSEDDTSNGDGLGDADSGVTIVKIANTLLAAAAEVCIRTKSPSLRMILPRVVEGEDVEVDGVLQRLRAKGIRVECNFTAIMPRPLTTVLEKMIPDPVAAMTSTLNMDCTVLLALISDVSHTDVEAQPWFNVGVKRQMESEDKESLLPLTLYPVLRGRELVCTTEAAERLREIVDMIATPEERSRMELLVDWDGGQGPRGDRKDKHDQIRAKFQALSRFDLPDTLDIPVRIVDKNSAPHDKMPASASKVKEVLSPINQSIFLYGWAAGLTTVTSNRTAVKDINRVLDEHAESELDWPRIWTYSTARSLVGKEKKVAEAARR